MNFFKRLGGVFFEPKATFQGLAERPVWADMLVFLLIILAAYSLLISPYTRHDQLMMMKDSAKLKETLGEERFNQQIQSLENPSTATTVWTLVYGPVFIFIALLLQSVLLLIFGRFMSTQGTFKQVFSALVHASAVNLFLGNAVRLVLILMRKSAFQTSTSLALLFPRLEVTSKAYVILTQIDIFQLWMFAVLAFGLAAIFKIEVKKSLFLSYVLWFLKSLANIGLALWGMHFLQ